MPCMRKRQTTTAFYPQFRVHCSSNMTIRQLCFVKDMRISIVFVTRKNYVTKDGIVKSLSDYIAMRKVFVIKGDKLYLPNKIPLVFNWPKEQGFHGDTRMIISAACERADIEESQLFTVYVESSKLPTTKPLSVGYPNAPAHTIMTAHIPCGGMLWLIIADDFVARSSLSIDAVYELVKLAHQ